MHVPYAFVRLNLKFKKVLYSGGEGTSVGTFDSGFEFFIRTMKSLGKVLIKIWNIWEPLDKVLVFILEHGGITE